MWGKSSKFDGKLQLAHLQHCCCFSPLATFRLCHQCSLSSWAISFNCRDCCSQCVCWWSGAGCTMGGSGWMGGGPYCPYPNSEYERTLPPWIPALLPPQAIDITPWACRPTLACREIQRFCLRFPLPVGTWNRTWEAGLSEPLSAFFS